jgi:tetratricopeptide (TPR) repeat protein
MEKYKNITLVSNVYKKIALFLLGIYFFYPFSSRAETIILKSGKMIRGRIVDRNNERIKVDIDGIPLTYYFEDIESIDGEKISLGLPQGKNSSGTDEPQTKNSDSAKEATRTISVECQEHYAKAEEYIQNKQYDSAIAEFKKVIQIDPRFFEAYNSMGFVYIQLGQYEEAIVYFQKALEINPNYAPAYDNIGVANSFMRRYQEAVPYYKKAIYIDPTFLPAYNNLGTTYIFLNRYQEAIDCYENALKADPLNADAHYNLGIAYYNIGKFQEAKDNLKKAKQLYQFHNDFESAQKAEQDLSKIR